jgi:hypothetical protein
MKMFLLQNMMTEASKQGSYAFKETDDPIKTRLCGDPII